MSDVGTRKAKLEYHHVVQKPSLCGPTSLQMVLQRHGKWLDQEEIAKEIGAKVVAEDPKELGMDLDAFGGQKVKAFLSKHAISLKTHVYKSSEITDLGELIYTNLKQGNDVMIDIWMAHYVEDLPMGHFCLISAIDDDTVTICDPWPTTEKYWTSSIENVAKAMDPSHDGTERGLVVFTKI